MNRFESATSIFALMTALSLAGCSPSGGPGGGKAVQNTGSDTMINLAQAWAEAYHAVKPSAIALWISG